MASSSPQKPYFDNQAQAWILTGYEDVLAGLEHARLTLPESLRSGELGVNEPGALRRRIAESLGPPMLKRWQDQGEVSADTLLSALPRGEPVDVVGRFVRPWALELARLVTQADAGEPALLVALCEQVSAAAASPEESRTVQRAQEAGTQLDALLVACGFPMAGPTFVALSQTLPCFLAKAWFTLLRHPKGIPVMRSSRSNNAAVVEELLRIGGLARSVSRVAREDVEIGGARIRTGQHVELRLDEANHDSSRFSQPDLFCPSRGPTRHVALGAGAHACPGAALIRMAAAVTTRGLLRRFHSFTPVEQKWRGGSGFRWPEPLCVVLE